MVSVINLQQQPSACWYHHFLGTQGVRREKDYGINSGSGTQKVGMAQE